MYLAISLPSDPAPLGRPATVVRNRRHVADGRDLDAGGLKRAQRSLTASARSLDQNAAGTQPVLLGLTRRVLGSQLGREGRGLTGALEATPARAGPSDRVPYDD